MKKILATFVIPLLALLSNDLMATHVIGGAVTWKCLKSGPYVGKYVFTAKLYRLCGFPGTSTTITAPTSFTLTSNSPITSIVLPRRSSFDITPSCYLGQEIDCYDVNTDEYAIEENIYDNSTSPLTLTGVPPASGWYFRLTNCCRTDRPIIDNLHPQNQSLGVEAKMYPYNNENAYPCFDSSPEFAASPPSIICTGYEFNYISNVTDAEFDSLVINSVSPQDASGLPVTYADSINTPQITPRSNGGGFIVPAPGFSPGLPLPWSHPNMDTNNRAAVLDPATGILNFLSYTPGRYTLATEANAYRCGQLIATVVRDAPIILFDCPPLPSPMSSTNNAPPSTSFIYKGLPIGDELKDTVYAGDLVTFDLQTIDAGILPGSVPQSITVTPFQSNFGTLFTDSLSGCNRPPCATADTNSGGYVTADNNWQATGSTTLKFSWRTDCNHLSKFTSCYRQGNTFQFHFNVKDDFCPVPGQTNVTASITVLPDTNTTNIVAIDSLTKASNDITLHWTAYTGPGFSKYYIHKFNPTTLLYKVIASIPNIVTTAYTDMNLISSNRYYISIDSNACHAGPAYTNLDLSLSKSGNGKYADLDWNDVLLLDHNDAVKYMIYRTNSPGSFTLIDSTLGTTYRDSMLPCIDTVSYFVKAVVNGAHFTNSAVRLIKLTNIIGGATSLTQALVDTNGNVFLNWNMIPTAVFNTANFQAYIIYVATDSTGPYSLLDSVTNWGTTNYTHYNAGADTVELYYYIKIRGFSECLQKDTLSKRSNILSSLGLNIQDLNNGFLELSWTPFYFKHNKTPNYYYISRRYNTLPWTLLDSTLYGNEQYIDSVVICNENIYYKVEMDSLGSYVSVENAINISGYNGVLQLVGDSILKGPKGLAHNWFLNGDPDTTTLKNTYVPTSNGIYHAVVVLSNGCQITTNQVFVDLTDGIDQTNINNKIQVYPNPHSGQFDVTIVTEGNEKIDLELFNNTGKQAYHSYDIVTHQKTFRKTIDLHDWPKGLYLLKISVNETVYTKKVLFQ